MGERHVQHQIEYEPPEIRDYGDLKELTAAHLSGSHTDVPSGMPAPEVFDFSVA